MTQRRTRTLAPSAPARVSKSAAGPQRRPAPAELQRVPADPATASPGELLALQRTAGNRAVSRLVGKSGRPVVQAKLTVGAAGDKYEQEADRVASDVMRQAQSGASQAAAPNSPIVPEAGDEVRRQPLSAGVTPVVQRESDEPEDEGLPAIRRAAGPGMAGSFDAGGQVESRLAANKGRGNPLPSETKGFMEGRFGADFSGVRVHTGGESAQLNRTLSAQAFTHGQDIYMGPGKYEPGTQAGKQLLAHELTHVVQQTGATQSRALVQRKGGLGKFASSQWEGYKQDMSGYASMLEQGFVGAPTEAYDYFAPTEEDKKKKGFGQSLKRGGQHVLGGIAAGLTGAYTGALSLGAGALGAVMSTVGRGLAVAGRGLWSMIKGTPGALKSVGSKISNKWDLMRGKKGTGHSAQAASSRMDIGHTATTVLNATVSQTVGTAVEAGTTGAQVLAAVTGPISTVLNLIKGAVSAARAHRARQRQNAAEQAAKDAAQAGTVQKQLDAWLKTQDRVSEEEASGKRQELEGNNKLFLEAVLYLGGKNKAKKWRSILESTGALVGAAGSAALTGGMIAASVGLVALLASNPVGWGIALGLVGASLVTAIGYGLYKLGKSIYKGKEKGVNREKYAEAFFQLVNNRYQPAIEFLKEIGVLKDDESGKGKFSLQDFLDDDVQAKAYLKGKMRST